MTDEVVKYKDENIGKNVNYPWYYAPLDFKLDYADSNKDIYEALQKAVDTNDYENVPASLLSRAQQVKDYQEKGTAGDRMHGQKLKVVLMGLEPLLILRPTLLIWRFTAKQNQ